MHRKKIFILDGYNVIRRVPEFDEKDKRKLELGREALIRRCAEWKARKREIDQIFIVFDGNSSVGGLAAYQQGAGLGIVFTETGEQADSRILDIVENLIPTADCTVVSDDGEVFRKAKLLGATAMSVTVFHAMLSARRKAAESRAQEEVKSALSPQQEREITESLKKEWGIE